MISHFIRQSTHAVLGNIKMQQLVLASMKSHKKCSCVFSKRVKHVSNIIHQITSVFLSSGLCDQKSICVGYMISLLFIVMSSPENRKLDFNSVTQLQLDIQWYKQACCG